MGAARPDGPPVPPDAAWADGAAGPADAAAGPVTEAARRPRHPVVWTLVVAFVACMSVGLASCYSFLTTCDANPRTLFALEDARGRARDYWRSKYGEDVEPSEADFALYYGGWSSHRNTDEVVVNMGEAGTHTSLVYLDLTTGRISDNRQAPELQQALSAYVTGHLAELAADSQGAVDWVTTTSDLANMPDPYEPFTDGEWELAQTPGSLLSDYYGMTRDEANALAQKRHEELLAQERAEVEPIVFNLSPLAASNGLTFEEDDPTSSKLFFTAYYDGDIEAFIRAEQQAGGLAMDTDDELYLAVAGGASIPTAGAGTDSLAWRRTADDVAAWLDATFAEHPGMTVLPTRPARRAQQDTSYRYARYPARYTGADGPYWEDRGDGSPVIDNWVYLDEQHSMRLESDLGGLTLADADVSVRRSAATEDAINAALAEAGDDRRLVLTGDVFEVTFQQRVRELAPVAPDAGDYDDALPLRLAFYRPDLDYDFSGSERSGEPNRYQLNEFLYVVEVAGVGEDGSVRGLPSTSSSGGTYMPLAAVAFDGWPVEWGMHDPANTLLFFVAKEEL